MRFLAIFLLALLLFGCTQQSSQSQQLPAQTNYSNVSQSPSSPPIANSSPTTQSAPSLSSEEITFNSNGWQIYGSYYVSSNNNPTKVILLLPGLGDSRAAYPVDFIQQLHDSMPDASVLAMDLRGQGKSSNLGSWQQFSYQDFYQMKTDVISADNYLSSTYPTVKEFYVVGASVGSTAAITAAAQDSRITKLVLLSPGQSYNGVDITDASGQYKHGILAIASSGDQYAASTVQWLSGNGPQVFTKIYGGSAHGTELFQATKNDTTPVTGLIVNYLQTN